MLTVTGFEPSGSQERSFEAGAFPQESESLVEHVRELAAENMALRERLGALELDQVPSGSARAAVGSGLVSQEEFEAFREEVRLALEKKGSASAQLAKNPEVLKGQVASALHDIRKAESVGKVRAFAEGRLERLDESMPKMEDWLGLTSDQSAKMRTALLAQYDREAELIRRWEAGEDDQVLGELKRSDRERHMTELSGFLSPGQLETYSSGGGPGGSKN